MKTAFNKLSPEKQAQILDAATALFAERGFAGASISDICVAAGISNGALYKYFVDKDDLFVAAAERGASILESFYDGLDDEALPADYFRALFTGIRDNARAFEAPLALYIECGAASMNRFAPALADRIESIGLRHVRDYLERAMARGWLSADADLARAVFMVDSLALLYAFSMVSDYHRRRLRACMAGKADTDDETDFLVDAALAAALPANRAS